MSAIYGILSRDGPPPDHAALRRLGDALAHHGDGPPCLWSNAGAALGCCHLPTTPEAVGETVPFVHPASGVVVTADVRLDERADLIAALGLATPAGRLLPDGALLAEAYLKWGDACPEHLLGDFAFGLWDPRQRRFFAARDHFGIKPFYYVADSRRFAFATEPRPLLDLPGVDRAIDRTTLAISLANLYDESDRTFYRAVRSLGPAQTLIVAPSDSGPRTHRYYRPDPERRLVLRSDAEYAEAFREMIFRAVRRRLRSSGPVGSMLSGGLDSSAVTSVAARIAATEASPPRLETFSLVYPEHPECDETPYIQAVVRRWDLPWHPVPVDDRRTLEDVRRLVDRLQAPDVPLGAFANGSVCARAAARGMRVLLDGHGGDETVSLGFEWLRELLDDGRTLTLAYEYLRLAPAHPAMRGWRGLAGVLTNRGLAGRIKRRLRRIAARGHEATPLSGSDAPWPFLSAELIREADLPARAEAARETETRARAARRWHHHALTRTAQERAFANLRRLAGVGKVELRYPLWDKDLVEFCLRRCRVIRNCATAGREPSCGVPCAGCFHRRSCTAATKPTSCPKPPLASRIWKRILASPCWTPIMRAAPVFWNRDGHTPSWNNSTEARQFPVLTSRLCGEGSPRQSGSKIWIKISALFKLYDS